MVSKYVIVGAVIAAIVFAFILGQNVNSSSQSTTSNMVPWPNVHQNVQTDFNSEVKSPQIENDSFIHPFAIVIGDCHIGKMVLMAPTSVCRGDEGTPIYIGDYSNVQDGVILHALETSVDGQNIDNRRYSMDGVSLLANDSRFADGYAIFVGSKVSLAHDSMVHGPAWIGNNTFVGMKSLVFNAKVGSNVAIGVSSTITNGVVIADNKFVPPGSVIVTQEQADALPSRIGSAYENINKDVIHVNENLAEAYNHQDIEKIKYYREALMEEEGLVTAKALP
ncbi:MAG TPA: carbonic anhydrase [Candidatus Nitrosotalea sp.]|nr:carbonic anhydrase [Candidatus Nitrosotalea sp.]